MLVADRRSVARDDTVVELTLTSHDGSTLCRWHPGAHIDLHLPSGRTRQYTLCGDPHRTQEYRIAVRRIPGGSGGSVEVHGLDVGQTVEISDPRNAFTMAVPGSGSKAAEIRFIAGGIGITPILPMVRLAERLDVPWSLCYTGRRRDNLPFLDELAAWGDRAQVHTGDEHGRLTASELLDGVDDQKAVYLCGPASMVETVRRVVPLDSGMELHVERFSPLSVVDGIPFEIELARSARIVQVGPDQTALQALRAAVPNVGYSCRQGFCGTCVQRVIAGDVEHRDALLTDQQRESGQMLVCVSRAESISGRLVLDL
ncbi:PDR/VanB family oxidoreductase [Mycobacterium sp. NPDC049093]